MDSILLNVFLKAIVKAFLNPIVYWIILLVVLSNYERIKRERFLFRVESHKFLTEMKGTWLLSIISGITISLLTIGVGITLPYELIIILTVLLIVLSITYRYTLLSASYTLGLTFLISMFLFGENNIHLTLPPSIFSALSLLIGILLIFEAISLIKFNNNDSFPDLVYSKRGKWIGQHHLKKLMIIPFIVLVPRGTIISSSLMWPYFSIGEQSYSLLAMPLLIGFHHVIRGELPNKAARKLGKLILLLALFVIALSLISIEIQGLSLIAVVIAIIGRIYIHYKYFKFDRKRPAYFIQDDLPLKVLGVRMNSPAERLGIQVGEIITKVNNHPVETVQELEEQININGGLHHIELVDINQKVRNIDKEIYNGDRLDLGIIVTTEAIGIRENNE